uniref:Uncharacterized protein n=1 Tax=Daucus carota subsp. sativus TaxID=79200 RepID=A0A166HTE2_DAUCS
MLAGCIFTGHQTNHLVLILIILLYFPATRDGERRGINQTGPSARVSVLIYLEKKALQGPSPLQIMSAGNTGTPKTERDEAYQLAEAAGDHTKEYEADLQRLGLGVQHREDRIRDLRTQKISLDGSILDLEGSIGKYHESISKPVNKEVDAQSEDETYEKILELEKSAAGLVHQLRTRQGTQVSDSPLVKDVLGFVATLGKVDDSNLSWEKAIVKFPMIFGKPSLPGDYYETKHDLQIKKWNLQILLEDIRREQSMLDQARLHFEVKRQEFVQFLAQSSHRARKKALQGPSPLPIMSAANTGTRKTERDEAYQVAEPAVDDTKKYEADLQKLGLGVKHREDRIRDLSTQKISLDGSILDLQGRIGKYHESISKPVNKEVDAQSEDETYEKILELEKSAAGLVHQLRTRQGTQVSHSPLVKDVLGFVATLGKADDENLSWEQAKVKFPMIFGKLTLLGDYYEIKNELQIKRWNLQILLEDIRREQSMLDQARLNFEVKRQEFVQFLAQSSHRARARKLQERGWQPRWFRKDEEGCYRYVGGYWKRGKKPTGKRFQIYLDRLLIYILPQWMNDPLFCLVSLSRRIVKAESNVPWNCPDIENEVS